MRPERGCGGPRLEKHNGEKLQRSANYMLFMVIFVCDEKGTLIACSKWVYSIIVISNRQVFSVLQSVFSCFLLLTFVFSLKTNKSNARRILGGSAKVSL